MEDQGSIPGLGRSPGEGKGYPLQYSGLENSTDYVIHGIAKSWTRLNDFHFTSLHIVLNDYNDRVSKEIVGDNRMGKTSNFFTKIRDTKGIFEPCKNGLNKGQK